MHVREFRANQSHTYAATRLNEIISTFGDIFAYIGPDHALAPGWQNDFLDRVALPFALPLSWDISRSVRQFTCHKY